MKYRYLTYQELDLLRYDFQDFLYQERTTHYEWKVLQDQHSKVALNLLSKYSDITFDKVMQDISYLYFNDGFEIKSF